MTISDKFLTAMVDAVGRYEEPIPKSALRVGGKAAVKDAVFVSPIKIIYCHLMNMGTGN